MKDEYDFTDAKRGPIISNKGKSRITIYIDDNTLQVFRERAEAQGRGYQTLINAALNQHLVETAEAPVTESALRRVLQEQLSGLKLVG